MADFTLDPKRTALIIQDMQNDVIIEGGAFAESGSPEHAKEQNVVANSQKLADACRAKGVAVIHVHYIVEEGAPGLKVNAPLFQGLKEANALVRGLVAMNIFDHYPDLPFVDYTKSIRRFNRTLPANYHLTLSRSDLNETECLEALARGINVAVCFAGDKPAIWRGFDVIDGDAHDLRQLDPRGERGVVVALSPKGRKAKRDQSGFVVR